MNAPERSSSVFTVYSESISQLFLVLISLRVNRYFIGCYRKKKFLIVDSICAKMALSNLFFTL